MKTKKIQLNIDICTKCHWIEEQYSCIVTKQSDIPYKCTLINKGITQTQNGTQIPRGIKTGPGIRTTLMKHCPYYMEQIIYNQKTYK